MELINFIDSGDRDKLKVISMFEEENLIKIPFEQLMTSFGFSRFKLNNHLKQLNEDLGIIGVKLELISLPVAEVRVAGLTNEKVRRLRLVYLQKSAIFEMFSELLVSKVSIEDFGKSRFISRSKTYMIRKELEEILAIAGLRISNKELSGSEQTIRKFAFEVYYYYLNGLAFPFSDSIRQKVTTVLNVLTSEVKIETTPTRMAKLELFIAISILRIQNKKIAEESLVELTNLKATIFEDNINFYRSIEERYNLSPAEISREIDCLLLFLITEDILMIDLCSLGLPNKKVKLLTSVMENSLVTELPFPERVSEEEKNIILMEMKQSLVKIHFKLVYFYGRYFGTSSKQQYLFFEKSYPQFHSLVEQFLVFLVSTGQFPQLHKRKLALYYDYMVSLISAIPMKYLKRNVRICVDFSKGEAYTNYIVNNLAFFWNLNIEIQKKLTNQTDIYLSDHYYNKALCKQVIWKNAPTTQEWRALGEVVEGIGRD